MRAREVGGGGGIEDSWRGARKSSGFLLKPFDFMIFITYCTSTNFVGRVNLNF
jgi:hypothetical protein